MERIVERCCGLDVGQKTVAACVRIAAPDGGASRSSACSGRLPEILPALRDWLGAHRVTHVAMESTGVYWKAVYYLLEDAFTVLLVNAQHMKNVPGRKTDVRDCAWIAELLEHGLLRGSFVPPAPIRQLRDLTRYRKTQIQERVREANRLHKVLEDAGVKLAVVASDVLGVWGERCWRRCCGGRRTQKCSPSSLAGRCARRSQSYGVPLRAASQPITAFWSGGSSLTWTISRRRSRNVASRSRSYCALSRRLLSASRPSRAFNNERPK